MRGGGANRWGGWEKFQKKINWVKGGKKIMFQKKFN